MQTYIGSDVTSMVTLPVIIFEPMTMLQKMAEVCASCSGLYLCFFPLAFLLYHNILFFSGLYLAYTYSKYYNHVTVNGIFPLTG